MASNAAHRNWPRDRLAELPAGSAVAVLGLTYKPGTSTLRRSSAVALTRVARRARLLGRPRSTRKRTCLRAPCPASRSPARRAEALAGAAAAVVATPWPEFRELTADDLAGAMADPVVIDEGWSLAALAADSRITYVAPGRARR